MEVVLIAKLRNGPMVRYREQHKVSQTVAAKRAGVSQKAWWTLECMKFADAGTETMCRVAAFLDITAEELCPEELRSDCVGIQRYFYREVEARRLLAANASERLLLPAPDTGDGDDALARELAGEAIGKVLQTLTYREREILKMRFGLDGPAFTLEEVGKVFKVTRERIRGLEAKAIRKLQHPVRTRQLERALDAF